jgi:hypothetical protein
MTTNFWRLGCDTIQLAISSHIIYYFLWLCSPALWPPRHTRFLHHTQRRATVGRTPLGRVISSSQRDNLTTHTTDEHTCPGGIRTHDRSRWVAVDLRLRPRGQWNRQVPTYQTILISLFQFLHLLSFHCNIVFLLFTCSWRFGPAIRPKSKLRKAE